MGPVVAATVGSQMLRYHLFGESTSVVQQLEQAAVPGASRCSRAFREALAAAAAGGAPGALLLAALAEAEPLEEGETAGQPTWHVAAPHPPAPAAGGAGFPPSHAP